MKCILIGSGQHDLLPTLESFLKHWGYRVLYSASENPFRALLETLNPDMALLTPDFLASVKPSLLKQLNKYQTDHRLSIVFLTPEDDKEPKLPVKIDHLHLDLPLDVFQLYQMTQRELQSHPRQRLRLDVKLPCMFSFDDRPPEIGEILTISEGGMFLKTSQPLQDAQPLMITIPLIGMSKELELESRVLYPIAPTQQNRYLQGAGIEFLEMTEDEREQLRQYIEAAFLDKISEQAPEAEVLELARIRRQTSD